MPATISMLLASGLALAASVSAHMRLSTPTPFGQSTLTSAPLAADGSDFPCKQRPGVYDFQGAPNPPMAIGASQTLAFIGGATHGGGSCQVSLTTDKNPTKDSKWQVIHSIEGNCPDGFDGNLSGDPNDQGSSKFQYTIPDGIQPGDYVLAWTWFNRIGNREMYMNCAPITVTAASKKRDAQPAANEAESTVQEPQYSKRDGSLPNMFVANIGNGCTTAEGGNVKFPNPGSSVDVHPTYNSKDAVGNSCGTVSKAATSGNSGSSGSSGDPGTPPSTTAPSAAVPTASPPPHAPAPSSPAPKPVASPVASTAPVPAPVPGNNASSVPGSCTPGQAVCSPDGKQIGTCDSTQHVTFFNVAQGTKCEGGYMVMAGGIRARSAKFVAVHGHARRGFPMGRW